MTKKFTRSVLLPAFALLLSVTLAVGALFAWFSLSAKSGTDGFELQILGKASGNVGVTIDGVEQSSSIRYDGVIPGRVFRISLRILEGADQSLYFAVLDPDGDVKDGDVKIADFLDVFCVTVRTGYVLDAFRTRFDGDAAGLAALVDALVWQDASGQILTGVTPRMTDGVLDGFAAGATEAAFVKYSLNALKWYGFGPAETADKACVPVVWGFCAAAGTEVEFDLEFAEQTFYPSDVDINVFQNRIFALRKFYIDTKTGDGI